MLRLVSLLLVLAGCVNPFAPPRDDSPLVVTVAEATTQPRIAWTSVGATSVWIGDAMGRTVWSIEAGGRTRADGRYERVLIPSPVAYGAFSGGGSEAAPRTITPAVPLVPGETYTVRVAHIGGGDGGFTGRRPLVRRGEVTFTVR